MKLIIAVCCILFFKATFAQGKKEGLPVTVKVITSVNVQESSVELTGVSNSLDAEPGEVYIEIITPSGTTDYLTGRADKKTGNYFIKYTRLQISAYMRNLDNYDITPYTQCGSSLVTYIYIYSF